MDPFWTAVALTCFAGAATVLGGLLAVVGRPPTGRGLGFALGLAAGVMVGVSALEMVPASLADLAPSLGPLAFPAAAAAVLAGAGVVLLLSRLLPCPADLPAASPRADASTPALDARRLHRLGLMTAGAIGLHNAPEGFVTFAGTLQDPAVGVALAVAMAVHNVPEGVAVAVPVRQATGSRARAFGWAALTGLAEPVGAVVLYLLLSPFITPALLAVVFAAVAGVMTALSLAALLPAARAAGGLPTAGAGALSGAAVMALSLALLG